MRVSWLIALCLAIASCDLIPTPDGPPPGDVAKVVDEKKDAKVGDTKADDTKADDTKADDTKADDTKVAKADDAPRFDGGVALFVVQDKGVVALTAKGFAPIASDFRGQGLSALTTAPDGRVYGLGAGGSLLEVTPGGAAPPTDIPEPPPGLAAFAFARSGTIWSVGDGKVQHIVDGAWTSEPFPKEGEEDVLFQAIAIDGEDRPWVSTAKAAFRRDDSGAWSPVAFPGSNAVIYLEAIGAGPDGKIYLPKEQRIFALGDTATKVPVKTTPYGSLTGLAFARNTYGVAKSIDGVSLFLPADKVRVYKDGRDFRLGTVRATAVDDQGRVWIAAEAGVAVLPLDAPAVEYRNGAFEEIAGTIYSMHVLGEGPPLPTAGELKKGSLTGAVTQDGAPVVGAKVELCPSPSVVYTKTPCHDAPLRLQGTTDAEGKFVFTDVPLGAYGIAVKAGREWQTTLIPDLGSRMTEGEAFDVGTLALAGKDD